MRQYPDSDENALIYLHSVQFNSILFTYGNPVNHKLFLPVSIIKVRLVSEIISP